MTNDYSENKFGFDINCNKSEEVERLKKKIESISRDIKILVTGPQRSGTNITTKILADMLKVKYIQEYIHKQSFLKLLFLLSLKKIGVLFMGLD